MRVLLRSLPSMLRLPAASAKVLEATAMTPLAVEFADGVKVADRVRPEPVMDEREPPVTVISPVEPFQEKEEPGSSEKEKVMVAVSPARRVLEEEEMATVGGVASRFELVVMVELAISCVRPDVLLKTLYVPA